MIYIIDHQDSFTWNVVHQFSQFDKVHCSDYFDINKKLLNKSDVIVFSPGPGSPKDYPETSKIYNKYKGKKKMIGICLGFQLILYNEGGKIRQQNKIYHGYQSKIKVNGKIKSINENNNLLNLINSLKIPIKKVAIELNEEIVDKRKLRKITLKKNDKIEIVHFIGGG